MRALLGQKPDLTLKELRAGAPPVAAVGIDWTFAPMADLACALRWDTSPKASGKIRGSTQRNAN
jgi:hypothetical protein